MSMPSITYTVTGIGTSPIITPDYFQQYYAVGVGVTVSATATYGVQFTFDDVAADGFDPASATWFYDSSFPNTSNASKAALLTIPCRGYRLNVSASTGTVKIQVQQTGTR